MAEPIQLTDPQFSFPINPISLPADDNTPPSNNTAESRASRAAYGLGTLTNQTQPEIRKQIADGKEDKFRSNASFAIDAYNQNLRAQSIKDLVVKGHEIPNELLANPPKANPETIIERAFGNAFTGQAWGVPDNSLPPMWYHAKREMPEEVNSLNVFTKESIVKNQYFRKKFDDVQDAVSNQSWLGYGVDQVLDVFQPYNEYKMRGKGEDASRFASLLLGNELKDRADAIIGQPDLDHAKPMLDKALDDLKGNPGQQMKFMQYIMQSGDTSWDNLWTAAMAGGAAAGTAKRLGQFAEIFRASKDLANVSKIVGHGLDAPAKGGLDFWREDIPRSEMSPKVAAPLAKGDVGEAAVQAVSNELEKKIIGGQVLNPTQRAVEPIASAFRNLRAAQATAGAHMRELVNRINEDIFSRYSQLIGLLHSQQRIDRIPDISRNPAAVRAIKDQTAREHPELSGHVIDVRGFIKEPVANNWYTQLVLGRNDAEGFESVAEAQSMAEHLKLKVTSESMSALKTVASEDSYGKKVVAKVFGPRQKQSEFGVGIEHSNGKYYLVKDVPVDETKGMVRQFYGSTAQSKAPWGPIRAWTTWLQTPEETMTADQRAARLIATEGPAAFYKFARESTKNMQKLSKSEANDLDRMLKLGQEMKHPDTGKQGYYFRSIQEVDDTYQRLFNDGKTHIPSDNFVAAYFEFKTNMEMDYWMRKASVIRNHTRLGGMDHTTIIRGPDGKQMQSPWYTGRRIDKFPRGRDQVVALFPSTNPEHATVKAGNQFSGKTLEQMEQDVANGKARLVQIIDPDLHPLDGFAGITRADRPEFVISYNYRDRPISWEGADQLGRTEGGHLEHEYTDYISQARVYKNRHAGFVYNGDTNLFGTMTPAEARLAAKHLDRMREFRIAKDEAGAKDYWRDNPVAGLSFKDIWEKFEESRDPKGNIIPPVLNEREPIQHRPKDKMIIDLGKSALEDRYKLQGGIIDGTKTGNLARSSAIQYTGERDAYDFWGLRDIGSKYNPVFQVNQAQYIDAVPMMNRGLGRIINSLFMDDYKTSAVNHWLFGASVPSQADPTKLVGAREYLTATEQELAHSPFFYFHHPVWKAGTPDSVKSALMADQMKIKSFLGLPSTVDSFLHSMEQKIADSVYGKFGPKAMKLAPLWQLSALSDAPKLLRSIIHNAKMGFFSPRQFLIHFFTFINAALIAPKYAGQGAMAAMFHGWTSLSRHPDVLKLMDEKISKMNFLGFSGWKPGEWREAHETLLKTGFNHVDLNQLALRDNPMANNIIKNKGTQFLDAGMLPFRGGVGSLKTASWYTAFKEFRDAHPTGPLRDQDIEAILLRSNDLSHNMSRASTSAIQKGMMTFGAQFSSYNLRLAELLTGKRLTHAERARLFFGYAGIFGVPTAGGIVGLSTLLRDQVDKGNVPGLTEYTPGYDFTSTAIMEGLVPAIFNEASGHVPNLGESYGAKDLEQVERTLDADTTLWEFFGGAAYSTLANTWANTTPFRNAMMSILRGDGPYTVTSQDWVHLLSEISSVNYAWRTYMAYQTGMFMSRNGQYLEPTSPEYATFSGITGLTDQSVADIYRTGQEIKERRAAEAQTFREYSRTMQQYFTALKDNNQGQADALGKRASILLQSIPVQDRGRAMGIIARDQQPLVERINWQRVNDRSVPDADRQRQLNIETKRKEVQQRNQQ